MPRIRTVLLVTGAALLAKRAMRRRIDASPLWPLPALEEPVSGRPRSRALRLLVTRHETVADGVVQLRLEGDRLPAWKPGAHLDLVLPSGLVRQYSLCGDPEDTSSYTVATRLIGPEQGGRGGSREVHEQLQEGAEVEVRGPRNRFPLAEADAYVFVAGGIGITPILPMLREVEAAGRSWRLLYGAAPGPRCRSWRKWRNWRARRRAGSRSSRRTRADARTSPPSSRTWRPPPRSMSAAPRA